MTILLLSENFLLDGVTRHIIDLANGLAHMGHKVVVAATPSGEEARLSKKVVFLPLSLCHYNSYKKKYFNYFFAILLLIFVVRKNKIQIIHTHKRYADFIGRIVARCTGIHHVSTCHNEFTNHLWFSCFGDITIAPCDKIAFQLIEYFRRAPATVSIIPYGILGIERYTESTIRKTKAAYSIAPTQTVVLSVGHFNGQKDRPTLIEAIRIVRDRGYDHRLIVIIVGEGEEETKVKGMIRRYSLESMIRILPAHSDITALKNICDFCILSSKHEALPHVLLEAASVGKPFIATNVGCIPSFLSEQEAGTYVPPENPVALSTALIDFLEHPEIVRQKGISAQNRFEKFHTYERFIAQTLKLYEQFCCVPSVLNIL